MNPQRRDHPALVVEVQEAQIRAFTSLLGISVVERTHEMSTPSHPGQINSTETSITSRDSSTRPLSRSRSHHEIPKYSYASAATRKVTS